MQQQEDESLEDYVERFIYNLQNNRNDLNLATIRTIFLKGTLEENMDILNLMASGDVSQKSFEDIVEMCRKYSRSKAKAGKGVRAGRCSHPLGLKDPDGQWKRGLVVAYVSPEEV